MKKHLLLFLLAALYLSGIRSASAQMFYNPKSNFDSTGSTSYTAQTKTAEEEIDRKEMPFEKIVAQPIRERIRADAAYIVGEPDETVCYGIVRKSPKKRTTTLDGYAHTGNCGALNETGMEEIRKTLFDDKSYDLNINKIASCVVAPKLVLRFRKGFDFVDVLLSGSSCPAVQFLYAGETKDFSAKPIKEWLDTFIDAVSNDLEPVNPEEMEKKAAVMFRKRSVEEEAPAEAAAAPKPQPAAPKKWGRRAVVQQEENGRDFQTDPSVPPPPR